MLEESGIRKMLVQILSLPYLGCESFPCSGTQFLIRKMKGWDKIRCAVLSFLAVRVYDAIGMTIWPTFHRSLLPVGSGEHTSFLASLSILWKLKIPSPYPTPLLRNLQGRILGSGKKREVSQVIFVFRQVWKTRCEANWISWLIWFDVLFVLVKIFTF